MALTNQIPTQVYLDAKQHATLERKAREEKSEISDLIRRAIDVYIDSGITPGDLLLLDAASLAAKKDIDATLCDLDEINSTVRALKKEILDLRSRAARGEIV